MSNPYRTMIARLAAALQQQVFRDPEMDGNHLPRQAQALLDQPEPSGHDDPARFAAWLRKHSSDCIELGRPDWAHMSSRAAELLEQHPTPPPRKP
jgi:hypothetical protein